MIGDRDGGDEERDGGLGEMEGAAAVGGWWG